MRNAISAFVKKALRPVKLQENPNADLSHLTRPPHDPKLSEIVRNAWAAGKEISLPDAAYGPAHWSHGDRFVTEAQTYYYFLAGFVQTQKCTRILEIGTHYGGSTLAMLHGLSESDSADIVTIDITDLNPALHRTRGIRKLIGDANSETQLKTIAAHFGGKPIDLLFIDADHTFLPTITNFGIYFSILCPRYVIIDDVQLNDGMRDMWRIIGAAYGENTVDCHQVVHDIRPFDNIGFGLVRAFRRDEC